MSEQMDDFDVEVSPLAATSATSDAESQEEDVLVAPDGDSPDAPPIRRISLAARRTRMQRLLRAGAAITLLAVLVAAILLLPTGNRDAFLGLVTPPTPFPTETPQPGNDGFLWEHTVPWGQLFIDGKPGPDVSGSAVRQSAGLPEGAVFHLARGHHTIEYRAAPFPTLKCVLTVPVARGDTCPLERTGDYSFLTPTMPATRLLDLQATVDRLPKTQADALVAAAQAELTSLAASLPTGALTPGDHYLNGAGQLAQATTTLRIEPQFHLDSSVREFNGLPCAPLCSVGSIFPYYNPGGGWPVQALIALSWRYTTPAGQVVQADGPAIPTGALPITLISLSTWWTDEAWQTPTLIFDAPETDPVICPTGAHALDVFQATPAPTTVDQNFQWPYIASTAELGCLFAGSETDTDTGKPTGPIALVFYRAGALVAANAAAQHDFPTLPHASAHERALANAVAPTQLG
ncbi:MAG TPA: hypothetical protein VH393_03025 [Ktedonobacterales bacterium]